MSDAVSQAMKDEREAKELPRIRHRSHYCKQCKRMVPVAPGRNNFVHDNFTVGVVHVEFPEINRVRNPPCFSSYVIFTREEQEQNLAEMELD